MTEVVVEHQATYPQRTGRLGCRNQRWEFVFQPKYAAYLNLIEPWWKTLRSLAFKGRRFETWEQMEEAVSKATCAGYFGYPL